MTEPKVTIRYEPDHVGFGQIMMGDPIRDLAMAAARRAKLVAIFIAPYSGENKTHYKDNFEVQSIVVAIDGNPRRAARLVNWSRYATAIEFGGLPEREGHKAIYGRPQRVLARSGMAVGEFVGGSP
jgi:hypothetical protein